MPSLHTQIMQSIGAPSLMHAQGERGDPVRVVYVGAGGQEIEMDAIVGPIRTIERDLSNDRKDRVKVQRRWVVVVADSDDPLVGVAVPQMNATIRIDGEDSTYEWSIVEIDDASDSYRRIWVEKTPTMGPRAPGYQRNPA